MVRALVQDWMVVPPLCSQNHHQALSFPEGTTLIESVFCNAGLYLLSGQFLHRLPGSPSAPLMWRL